MNKENLVKAFKILLIILLLGLISMLVILNWKSDLIIDKVLKGVQQQLTDSITYHEATLDIFGHFPSVAVSIRELKIGSGEEPLIDGGQVDLVIRLFPLLRGETIISKLQVSDTQVHLVRRNDHWSFDILKKADQPRSDTTSSKIEALVLENTIIHYDDGSSMRFQLTVDQGTLKGSLGQDILETSMNITGAMSSFSNEAYSQPVPFPFSLEGNYRYAFKEELHEFSEVRIENENMILRLNGAVDIEGAQTLTDLQCQWEKADPEFIKSLMPETLRKDYDDFDLRGTLKGSAVIKGTIAEKITPGISAETFLEDGSLTFIKAKETLKGLTLDVRYDNGLMGKKQRGRISIAFKQKAVLGAGLEGTIHIDDIDHPVMDISLHGRLPATLLNLANVEGLHFESGDFDIEQFELKGYNTSSSLSTLLEKGRTQFEAGEVKLQYRDNAMHISEGKVKWTDSHLDLSCDAFKWNKATITNVASGFSAKDNLIDFTLKGNLCEGEVDTKGKIRFEGNAPVWESKWIVKGIEIQSLLESFDQFDQDFITSQHLNGKTNIWASSVIPMDEQWNIITKKVSLKGAIDIRDGRLKDMKTLEDFSDYIHLDDLKDIRFNQIRNYMKIEHGKVYLPVMFIQSSAVNMSISGEHSFDQNILYHVKLNAGQVASTKLKKQDLRKDYKPARKSGWINMYFVLYNTADNVMYKQNRTDVIAGFEQSTAIKESLRNDLVDLFGYDVYWIEPNEWEDIPEYE